MVLLRKGCGARSNPLLNILSRNVPHSKSSLANLRTSFLIFLPVSNRSQLCLRLRLKTFSKSRTPLPTCSLWYLPLPFYVFASAGFTYLPVVFEYLPLAVCTRVAVFRGRQLEGVDGSVGRVMAVWGGRSPNPSPIISGDRLSAVYWVPKHISTPRKMVKETW